MAMEGVTMSDKADQPMWMTREEIADAMDVSPGTVTRLLRSGKIAGFKIGRQWRVRPGDFERYLEAVANIPGSEARIGRVLERLDPLIMQGGADITADQVERIEELVRGGVSLMDATRQALRGDDS
jgi:excisionase family DNA binding protein